MNKIYIHYIACITILFSVSTACLPYSALHQYDDHDMHALDIPYEFPELDDYPLDDIAQTERLTISEIPPELILQVITSIGGIDTLQQDIFLHTNPLNRRDILDLPMFELHQYQYKKNHLLSATFFYNQTSKAHFTKNTTCDETLLESYLALNKQTLLGLLQNNIMQLQELYGIDTFNLNVAEIFSLIGPLKIQERRSGIMFQGIYAHYPMRTRIFVPFYYTERNFFLTDQERQVIEDEFGAIDPEQQEELQKQHAISDKLGFGDTRIEIGSTLFKDRFIKVHWGILTTLPTAFAVKRGLNGSSFATPSTFPTFDFDELFSLAVKLQLATTNEERNFIRQIAFDRITSFFLGASDRLAANLLDTPLGNGGHVGIGSYIHTKSKLNSFFQTNWAHRIKLSNRISLEYLLPRRKKRFFITRNNPQDFAARNFTDTDQAADNLTFLEQELVNKSHLVAFDTYIQPGLIFRWTSNLFYECNQWNLKFGTDLWIRGEEKQKTIHIPSLSALQPRIDQLDRNKTQSFLAYQNKICAGISYIWNKPDRTWYFSLYADATWLSSGIGKDFSLSFNIERNF